MKKTLRQIQAEQGISSQAIRQVFGCSQNTLRFMLDFGAYLKKINKVQLQMLADALGVSLEECWQAMCESFNQAYSQSGQAKEVHERYYEMPKSYENSWHHRSSHDLFGVDEVFRQKSQSDNIALNREDGGKLVRQAWISWASRQPHPKPSWLVEWQELAESDKEADRCIWESIVAPYVTMLAQVVEESNALRREIDIQQRLHEDEATQRRAMHQEIAKGKQG